MDEQLLYAIKDHLRRIADAEERQADALEEIAESLRSVSDQTPSGDVFDRRIATMLNDIREAISMWVGSR